MPSEIAFAKYQAAGNDFLLVRSGALPAGLRPAAEFTRAAPRALSDLALAMLDRHTGVGADGLFVCSPALDKRHHTRVRIFNADGGEAEMSGNGVRSAAAWLLDERRARPPIEIETASGLRTLETAGERRGERLLRARMGVPVFDPAVIPFAGPSLTPPVVAHPLSTSGGVREVTVTSMGNPHCSMLVADFDALDWRAVGREIESHPLFPNRTNVEFVRVISPRQIEVRFWERGVGETASSGTGSSAAAVAACLNKRTGRRVRVKTRGGVLNVEWALDGELYLTGPVRRVMSGKYAYPGRSTTRL